MADLTAFETRADDAEAQLAALTEIVKKLEKTSALYTSTDERIVALEKENAQLQTTAAKETERANKADYRAQILANTVKRLQEALDKAGVEPEWKKDVPDVEYRKFVQ